MNNDTAFKKRALRFVIMIGFVSLFADITYEGARSITGPYLALLGASATAVGFVAGFGELIGYGLRLVSGYISDKTGRYWTMTLIGYATNLIAVPLLAFAGRWEIAAGLIVVERVGKAIRAPSRDAILSHATKTIGQGFGFGLHEAMDQIGALLGPMILAAVLYFKGGYKTGFLILFIPALCALSVLLAARVTYPNPKEFDTTDHALATKGFSGAFWIYVVGVACIAAGYADFPLVAYHLKKHAIAADAMIPAIYAVAMGVDAVAAIVFGRLFDKIGIKALMIAACMSSVFAPFAFFGNFYGALAGMALWGIGMGAQESIMRAGIATMVAPGKRGSAYGIFNAGYGLFWFLGSALMGVLYDRSIGMVVVFSVVAQLAALPFLFVVVKKLRS